MTWTYDMDIWNGNMTWIFDMDIWHWYMKWIYDMEIWNGYMKWLYEMEIWNGYMKWIYEMDIWHGYIKWIYDMDIWNGDMTWIYYMDMMADSSYSMDWNYWCFIVWIIKYEGDHRNNLTMWQRSKTGCFMPSMSHWNPDSIYRLTGFLFESETGSTVNPRWKKC